MIRRCLVCPLFLFSLLSVGCRTLITVGPVETVLLEDFNIVTEARIDTGAELCSLGVDSVIPSADGNALFFVHDGKRYCCSRARTVVAELMTVIPDEPPRFLTVDREFLKENE